MASGDVLALFENKPTNLIINGGMDYFQRGTSVTGVGSAGQYIADRFVFRKTTGTAHVDRVSPADEEYAARLRSETADSGQLQMGTQIEYAFFKRYVGKTMTFSFLARGLSAAASSLEQAVKVYFRNDVADGDVKWGANATSSETFPITIDEIGDRYNVTFDIPADAKAMFIQLGSEIDQAFAINDGFLARNFMLSMGQSPVPFAYAGGNRFFDYMLCERYYENSYPLNVAPGTVTTDGTYITISISGENGATLPMRFRVRKRVTPVGNFFSHITGAIGNIRNNTTSSDVPRSPTFISDGGMTMYSTTTAGQQVQWHWEADAEL